MGCFALLDGWCVIVLKFINSTATTTPQNMTRITETFAKARLDDISWCEMKMKLSRTPQREVGADSKWADLMTKISSRNTGIFPENNNSSNERAGKLAK